MQSFNTRLVFDKTDEELSLDSPLKRLGNTTEVDIPQQLDHYPFGLQQQGVRMFHSLKEPKNRYRFNGKDFVERGLYNYGQRYYDPAIGWFVGVDPLAQEFAAWSGYNYVLGNPVMLVDPSKLAPEGWSETNVDLANRFGTFGGGPNTGDDVIIKGKNDSKVTILTNSDEDIEVEAPLDLHKLPSEIDLTKLVDGRGEILNTDIAIGYSLSVGYDFDAGFGSDANAFISNTMFLSGDYSHYWYTYTGH